LYSSILLYLCLTERDVHYLVAPLLTELTVTVIIKGAYDFSLRCCVYN